MFSHTGSYSTIKILTFLLYQNLIPSNLKRQTPHYWIGSIDAANNYFSSFGKEQIIDKI
jgi:hypothetical protein